MGIVEQPRLVVSRADHRERAARQPRGRFGLVDGEAVPTSPGTPGHNRVTLQTWAARRGAIRGAGVPCRASGDGATVEAGGNADAGPDVVVTRGPAPGLEESAAPRPVTGVEVLSPSARRVDTGRELEGFLRAPTVAHSLIADGQARHVLRRRRTGAAIATRLRSADGVRTLDPPGLSVGIAESLSDLDDTPAA